jgi:pimeloyl-ACP methyl ester carboxylesterase
VSFRLGVLPPIHVAQTRGGRLGYVVSGSGQPAIVLMNGAGVSLEGWRALYPAIESMGTVFAWNRAGVKGSDPPRHAQTGAAVIASLRELLGYAGVEPRFILVGHSLGGLFANLFARLHPREVAGLLLIEATHPGDHEVLRKQEALFAQGASKVLSVPQALLEENIHCEVERIGDTVREVACAGAFPDVPVTVVTGGKPPPEWMMSPAATGARRAHQQDLARLSRDARQAIAHASGHFPQLTEPELVLGELERLVRRVRH